MLPPHLVERCALPVVGPVDGTALSQRLTRVVNLTGQVAGLVPDPPRALREPRVAEEKRLRDAGLVSSCVQWLQAAPQV
jgi:hypothetical protein